MLNGGTITFRVGPTSFNMGVVLTILKGRASEKNVHQGRVANSFTMNTTIRITCLHGTVLRMK